LEDAEGHFAFGNGLRRGQKCNRSDGFLRGVLGSADRISRWIELRISISERRISPHSAASTLRFCSEILLSMSVETCTAHRNFSLSAALRGLDARTLSRQREEA
jgi:hypothetical protein